jgi:lipopolysaccharide export system protein LptA
MILRQFFLNLVILILLGATSFAQTAESARVAVLPFEVYSNLRSAGLQKMIAEDLSMRIADEGKITVVDHAIITTLLDKTGLTFSKSDLLAIAENLEADFLVLGSVTKIGENLSLDTYLFNPRGTPSFSKSYAEGKNLNALLKEMGTKINSQVLKSVLSYQKTQSAGEKVASEETGDTESVESGVEKSQEVSAAPAGDKEVTEGPVVAYAETNRGADDSQPPGSLIEEPPGERVAKEAGNETVPESAEEERKEKPTIIEQEEVETPEEPVVADSNTDSGEFADQPEELDSGQDNSRPPGSLTGKTVVEMGAEESRQDLLPLAVDEEDSEARDVLPETPEGEDTPATIALLKETDREETDRTEKGSEDKSFSSPFSTLKPVKITSKTMEADNKRNMVTFKGDVVVKQEDIVIFSDTMKVSYEPKGGINKVEASGNVKMSQENRIATGKKLVFYNPEQKIVMTGSPKIWQGDNLISCEKVTVLLEDNKIIFEGKVDSIIYPRSLQEEQKEDEKQVEEITIPPLKGEPGSETFVE